jgi:hypothetical protein
VALINTLLAADKKLEQEAVDMTVVLAHISSIAT